MTYGADDARNKAQYPDLAEYRRIMGKLYDTAEAFNGGDWAGTYDMTDAIGVHVQVPIRPSRYLVAIFTAAEDYDPATMTEVGPPPNAVGWTVWDREHDRDFDGGFGDADSPELAADAVRDFVADFVATYDEDFDAQHPDLV